VVTPTEITGLTVPPGSGNKLAIEIQTGTLPMQTLTQTFTYSKVSTTDNDGGGSGCSGGSGKFWWMLAALLPAVLIRRRAARP
jgi:Synergist-CTERM protein sorting domain-containing protein